MRRHADLNVFLLTAWLCFPIAGAAEEGVRFSRDVLPILADRCFHCHGPDNEHREADLRLDRRESAVDETAAVVPGEPEQSEMLARITSDDPDLLMPPPDSHRRQLSQAEIGVIRRWIIDGAPWGKHWSFETPIKPKINEVLRSGTQANPIDVLIRKRLAEAGLEPSPEADRRTLIRRVTLDLIGLPPTTFEVEAFLSDESQDAYDKLVNRLLASKHYGERMAWSWLDAARYADTSGFQGDPVRSMWPWRDWVIDAFNSDMPFDQFTIEQLAGDLLENSTPEQRLATAFNRNHMHNGEGGRIAEETRVENVFDRAETTGTVWLGLTLQCARCHDHKFDPTSNHDYFAFYDFFNQTSESGRGNGSLAVPPAMDYVSEGDRGRLEQARRHLSRCLEKPSAETAHALTSAKAEFESLSESIKPTKVMVMDTLDKPRETMVLAKGLYNSATDRKVTADVPSMLPPLPPKKDGGPYTRLDLARWIVSAENPLTARVIVNRYWQLFFGRGIVSTPSDFGLQGAQPTHPDLLDWLAVEFMESGWNVKHLHRLIVTSKTYRQSARVSKQQLARDPQNELLARASRYRMQSWMIRDASLAASGLLSSKFGGAPVKSYQPAGVWAEATFGKIKYDRDSGEKLYRRSIYSFWRRIVGPTVLFDSSKRQTCEVKPNLTNTPLHALTTLNDVTFVEAARVMAERLIQQHEADRDQIVDAFKTLTSRPPEPNELKLLETRLASTREQFRAAPGDAKALLAVGESPRDETLDVAEHAALTTTINTLMNLDEFLVKP